MLVKNRWFWGAIRESVRSDDFLLLRAAPRGVGVAIELILVCGGNRHHEPRYGSFSVCVGELRGEEAEFDDHGGDRLSFDGRG